MDNCIIFSKVMLVSFVLFIGACGGGSGDPDADSETDTNEETTEVQLTLFTSAEISSHNTGFIDAEDGGVVEHSGAILVIPAGALTESASITLSSTNLPSTQLDEGNFALLGRKAISPNGFVITADKDIPLNAPISLKIPIDTSLIPEQASTSDIGVATDTSGHLIPIDLPSSIDLDNGFIELTLQADILYKEANNALFGPPLGYLIPIAAGLGIGIQALNPILATVKTLIIGAPSEATSDHFKLYYSDLVSSVEASELLGTLEVAYDLFVDQMGFYLPNWINADGLYTVSIGDISTYSAAVQTVFKEEGGYGNRIETPAGYTIPGSTFFEGASFLYDNRDEELRKITAVHEFFHALQYGIASNLIAGNLGESRFNPNSIWLFEGSAAALAARVLLGNTTSPARDPGVTFRLRENFSLYDHSDESLPPDVAQDFFYFLERRLGNIDFYLPTFKSLDWGLNPLSDTERATRALDQTLLDQTNNAMGIELAWSEFVYDYTIKNSTLYGNQQNYKYSEIVPDNGSAIEINSPMAPLSYSIIQFRIPPLKKDLAGRVLPDQPQNLELSYTTQASEGFVILDLVLTDDLTASSQNEPEASTSTDNEKLIVNSVRGERFQFFYVVVTNKSKLKSDDATFKISAKLTSTYKIDIDRFKYGSCRFDAITTESLPSIYGFDAPAFSADISTYAWNSSLESIVENEMYTDSETGLFRLYHDYLQVTEGDQPLETVISASIVGDLVDNGPDSFWFNTGTISNITCNYLYQYGESVSTSSREITLTIEGPLEFFELEGQGMSAIINGPEACDFVTSISYTGTNPDFSISSIDNVSCNDLSTLRVRLFKE